MILFLQIKQTTVPIRYKIELNYEIMDLPMENTTETRKIYWKHSQKFDPTQNLYIIYKFTPKSVTMNVGEQAYSTQKKMQMYYKNLSQKIFPHRNLGLLHGKLHFKEKQEVMM